MKTRLTGLPLGWAVLMVALGANSSAAAGDTSARPHEQPLKLSVPQEAQAWVDIRTKAREAEPQRVPKDMLAQPDTPFAHKPYGAGYEARTSGAATGTPRVSETSAALGTARASGPPAAPTRAAGRGSR